MLCLGINPPPFLVLLSDLFYKIYPIALVTAVAALAIAVLFRRYHHFVVAVSIGALVLLLEPIVFLCLMLVPAHYVFDSESAAALFVFVLLVLLPVSLPVLALWLVGRTRYAIS